MGFLDKAKAAASDLAAKADTAMGNAGLSGSPASGGGDADRYFRDLGVLAFLEANARPADPGERMRVMAALQEMEARGAIRSYTLQTSPPPPPGMAGAGDQRGFTAQPGTAGSAAPPPPPPPPPAPSQPTPGEGAPQWQTPPPPSAPPASAPPPSAPPASAPPPSTPPPPPPSWMTKDESDNS